MIALNLFVAVIPLIIISYAFIEAFNPRRDVGNLIVGNLHLTGSTAQIVRDTFTNASSGKSVALSISLISPPVRPPSERSRRTLLAVGGQMPFAERRGAVSVLRQDPRQGRAIAGTVAV